MFYYCRNLKKIDMRKLDLTKTVGDSDYWMHPVPTSCEIIVKNEAMKEWFVEKHPSYTNVTIGS